MYKSIWRFQHPAAPVLFPPRPGASTLPPVRLPGHTLPLPHCAQVGAHDPSVRAMSGAGDESAKSEARVASRVLSERRRADGRRELASREAESMST